MSSGLPAIPGAARTIVKAMSPQLMRRIENLGMTPRQLELNFYWSYFATCQYDARKVDWDGSERLERVDMQAIATAGVLPGGFYDAGKDFPLRFRRPSSPYHIARVIVTRHTGLLFSESQHPKIRCVGDPDTEDYVTALINAGRLWAAMIKARNFGGGTGTAIVGFKFIGGQLRFEVFDPRWVTPIWKDVETKELKAIEQRYIYPEYILNSKQEYEEVHFWKRRLISEKLDVVWERVPVGTGEEPDWETARPDQYVEHNYGFCPVRWVQNKPVVDAEDGEPDCLGCYDMIEEMDGLLAQSLYGTKNNCDPTAVISSDLAAAALLKKGSDNSIKVEKGGSISYLEMTGTGPKTALESALKLRELVLEMTDTVLDPENAQQQTAYEVKMKMAPMIANSDVLREQYGQALLLPLLNDVLKAARILTASQPGKAPDGGPLRQTIKLPMREITDKEGNKSYAERVLPSEEQQKGVLELQWPPQFPPSLKDAADAADAVSKGKTAGAIDDEAAVRFCAPFFNVEDPHATLQKVKAEEKEREQEAIARAKEAFASRGGF